MGRGGEQNLMHYLYIKHECIAAKYKNTGILVLLLLGEQSYLPIPVTVNIIIICHEMYIRNMATTSLNVSGIYCSLMQWSN